MRPGAVAAAGAVALLAAALGLRWLIDLPPPEPDVVPDVATSPVGETNGGTDQEPIVRLSETSTVVSVDTVALPDTGDVPSLLDIRSVGRSGVDEDEFEAVVDWLRDDPAALLALVDEARGETDPERLDVLLRMLGDVDDPAVVALAAELVYSGDGAARQQGLDLLKRVRPGNPDVLAVVSDLLASESEAAVLVPTLTALARPGGSGDARASLVEQVALLSDHADAAVRRTSIDILARWSDDAAYTPRLVAGLSDADPNVRRAAAFAFVDRPSDDPAVHRALFTLAEDIGAPPATRRGALLSLRSMALEADQLRRIETVSRELDRR